MAQNARVVVALDAFACNDGVIKWAVKIAKHFDTIEFSFGDKVEIFFDAGSKFVVNDIFEIIDQKARDKFTDRSGEKFAFVGTVFFGDGIFGDLTIFEDESFYFAFFSL